MAYNRRTAPHSVPFGQFPGLKSVKTFSSAGVILMIQVLDKSFARSFALARKWPPSLPPHLFFLVECDLWLIHFWLANYSGECHYRKVDLAEASKWNKTTVFVQASPEKVVSQLSLGKSNDHWTTQRSKREMLRRVESVWGHLHSSRVLLLMTGWFTSL